MAQVPGRNEPDSPGELNFHYLFSTLENLGYQGYVGCEYKPLGEPSSQLWNQEPVRLCADPVCSLQAPQKEVWGGSRSTGLVVLNLEDRACNWDV